MCGFFPFEHDFDSGRHFEPRLAGKHAVSHIGGAYAGRERAERAVCAGVRVRADNEVSRAYESFLGQERVLDAHLTYVKEVFHSLGMSELTAAFALLGALDILVRNEVIHDKSDFALIEYISASVRLNLLDRNGGGDVIAENEVKIGGDQLTGDHIVKTCVRGKYLL